MPASCNHFTIY